MTAVTDIVRGSAVLLVGRVAQAVVGVGILTVTTRTLDVGGFGEFATALAVASLLGGVLNAALSDAYVTSDLTAHPGATGAMCSVLTVVTTGAFALATGSGSGALTGLAVGCYVTTSVGTAGRIAAARSAGRSAAIASAQLGGSVATAVVVVALALWGSHSWQLFLLAYALQPAGLVLLGRGGTDQRQPPAGWATVWQASRLYVAAQVGWTVLGQANVVLLRVLEGPDAAGEYAALVRLLDFLAIVAPLMAMLALPAFVTANRTEAEQGAPARLNVVIAGVGTAVLVAGMQFGWLGWRLLYGDRAFPALVFCVVGIGYGVSAACGLPDRLLQASGSPSAVARYAGAAAVGILGLGSLLALLAGGPGAAGALAVVLGAVNVGMLRASRPPRKVAAVHVTLIGVAVGATLLASAGDELRSWAVSVALAAGLAALAAVPLYWLRQSLRQDVLAGR